MRIKVEGEIFENYQTENTRFNHEIYSMILNNLSTDLAKKIHEKKRFKRLFSFTTLYIEGNKAHLYICGEDNLIKDFINNIIKNQVVRIGEIVMSITDIRLLQNELKESENYKFKGNLIVNDKLNGKVHLSENLDYIKTRINQILKDKYYQIYNEKINDNLEIDFDTIERKYVKYKNHHLNSYNVRFNVKGNNKLVNLMYNVGIGENTASGHGFIWRI